MATPSATAPKCGLIHFLYSGYICVMVIHVKTHHYIIEFRFINAESRPLWTLSFVSMNIELVDFMVRFTASEHGIH